MLIQLTFSYNDIYVSIHINRGIHFKFNLVYLIINIVPDNNIT